MLFAAILVTIAGLVLALGVYAIRGIIRTDTGGTGKLMLSITGLFAGAALLAFLSSLIRG